ncbi:MAG TPA: glutathione S-transferase family protein [Stellaceae bacterium]|nr:glutathione S-transferase family protein [Stellaceae bacterium]
MIVYGSSLAPAARKVLAFIGEKGVAAEHRPVAPHDASPEFEKASPLGQIPAFVDGAFCLSDSTAICHYLERRYPSPALFPADAQAYGRMVWFDRFADSFLGAAECKIVINLVVKRMRNEEPDMRAVQSAANDELPPLFDYLESQIGGPFLVGDTLSLADLAVASPFASLKIAGYSIDAACWPRLDAYVEGILGRDTMSGIGD